MPIGDFNAKGAMAGGGIGFIGGGPIGGLVGAGIGGFGGGIVGKGVPIVSDIFGMFDDGGSGISKPNKDDYQYKGLGEGYFQQQGANLYNRPAVQADLGQYQQSRALGGQSRDALGAQMQKLGALAQDDSASAAYRQMQAGGEQNMRQALALARSAGGSGAAQGSALRQAQFGQAQANAQNVQQAGIMRAQETAQANNAILQATAQQRAMDLQAQGMDAQTAMQQAGLELQSQALGQQGLLGMSQLGQQASALQQKGSMGYWQTLLGAEAAAQQAKAQGDAAMLGGGAALGSALITKSGAETKMNIAPVGTPPSGGAVFGSPGQPQITTGGAMQPLQAQMPGTQSDLDAMASERAAQGFGTAMNVYNAFQPRGPAPSGIRPVESYLPDLGMNNPMIDSDKHVKVLQAQNDTLHQVISQLSGVPTTPSMRKAMPVPAAGAQAGRAAIQPDVFTVTSDGQRARVASGYSAPMSGAEQVRAETGQPLPVQYALPAPPMAVRPNSVAAMMSGQMPTFGMTDSDEASKQHIAKLEGIIAGLSGNAGGRYMDLDQPTPEERGRGLGGPAGGPSWDSMVAVAGKGMNPYRPAPARATSIDDTPRLQGISGSRPSTGRMPDLTEQARAIPSYSWQYDPQHAAQANQKAGLPPTAHFGQATKVGPMAQDLAKLPATAGAVTPGPDGTLQVDGGQAAMTGLSMAGELARQTAELEKRIKGLESLMPEKKKGKRAPAPNIDDPSTWPPAWKGK